MQADRFDSAEIVIQWLKDHGFNGYKEQAFEGLMGDCTFLRFDIWLPEYNLCIEVDGQQHYQSRYNDSVEAFLRKREYARRKEFFCVQHGIRLVRVVYDELNYLDQTFAFLLKEKEDRFFNS